MNKRNEAIYSGMGILSMEMNIKYVLGNEELLDSVKALWEELNQLHLEKSPYFKSFYANNTFEARKATLLSTSPKGQICVILAYDQDAVIGYCIVSVADETGEIDSIFVCDPYRNKGIASTLMEKALTWLKQSGPKTMVIKVSVGNEEVFAFYAKYGFYPRLTELQIISE